MAKKISMQQIADRLGVSKYTVSQALSGKPGVSRGMRLQIIEMARTLGYKLPSVPQAQGAQSPAGCVKSPSAGCLGQHGAPRADADAVPGLDAAEPIPSAAATVSQPCASSGMASGEAAPAAGTAVKPPVPSAGISATMPRTDASATPPSGDLPASAAALPPLTGTPAVEAAPAAGTAAKPGVPSAGISATMPRTDAFATPPSGGLPASAAAMLPPTSDSSRATAPATAEPYNSGLRSGAAGLTSAPGSARAAGTAAAAMTRLLIYMEPGYMGEPDFWGRVLDGLLAACLQGGWITAFLEHAPEGASPLSAAEAASSAGLIVVGKTSASKLLTLRQLGLPMVLIDHEEPLIEADAILNANLEAARMACNHLLAQGSTSIVFAGRDSFAVSFKERWWGCRLAIDEWKAARREAPLQLKKWTLPYGTPGWRHQLAKRLDTLIAGGEALPDGFLCANDQMALQLVDTLAAKGIAVPERCRVVGIDNIAGSASSSPALTTVELAKESLGRRAVQAMERRLGSGGALSEKIILSARLIVRQSG